MQIDVNELDNLQIKLNQFQNNLTNTKPLMLEIANHLHNITVESFEKESSPDGKKWSPIKITGYVSKYYSKILYQEGDLQGSLYSKATKDSATVGLNAVSNGFQYPLTHQFGTNNAWGRGIVVPARPFLPIDSNGNIYEGVEKELMEIVDDYVELMSFKIN